MIEFPKSLEQLRKEQGQIFAPQRNAAQASVTEIPAWYAEQLAAAEKKAQPKTVEQMRETAAQTGAARSVPAQRMEYGDARLVFWECMKSESALFNRVPDVDTENREHIRQLVKWAICDPSGELDPLKGMAFVGNVGAGKTYFMRVLSRFFVAAQLPPCEIAATLDVFDAVAIDKDALPGYCAGQKCFDDFGQEPPMLKSYGNEKEVMGAIITRRHVKFERAGLLTHLTSNLTLEEIEARYGSRIYSRLLQMCNFITFGGTSRRK
jgi:DNA replication protein DnaC